MNNKQTAPIELIIKGGNPDKVALYGCGTCHMSATSREQAIACCAPHVCDKCGKENKSYCEDCYDKERLAKDQAQYDKAKKMSLSEYDGEWLCCDHCDEYYPDVGSLLDAHDDTEEPQTWAWGTTRMEFELDAERIISQELERQEFYEGAFDSIPAESLRKMQSFFNAWVKKQDLKSYMVDHSIVVDFELTRYSAPIQDVPVLPKA